MSDATAPGQAASYTWWDQVPANLKTKTQLAEAGLKPAGPRMATIAYGRGRRARCYDLYDIGAAIPKKAATAAQLAALEKGRLTQRTCRRCGSDAGTPLIYSYHEKKLGAEDGVCPDCCEAKVREWHLSHRDAAIVWARETVARANYLVLDTETTALDGELVEIAVLRPDGTTALDTLIKPSGEMGATDIHSITAAMAAGAPAFASIAPVLKTLLTGVAGRTVIVYNAPFDRSILEREVASMSGQEGEKQAANDWIQQVRWECLMEAYASYCGEWSERHGSYTWQPLWGDHRAMGDCRAALRLLHQMAETPLSTETESCHTDV